MPILLLIKLLKGDQVMAKIRKITSEVKDNSVVLTFGELGTASISIDDVPDSVKNDLLLFACKQKVTNATGGLSLEDAFEAGKLILQNIKDGNVKAIRETSAKSAIAKKAKGLPEQAQAEVLALIEKLLAQGA